MLQNQLNVIDPIIRATPDSASAEVMTNSYDHLGTITGAELKTLWNNQDWTIVPDGSSNNGGFGRTYQGLTELEVSATKVYSGTASHFGLPLATGINTLIFHEIGHITGPGLQVQRKYSGARPDTEGFKIREGKTSTIGSASARMVGVPYSCDVGGCR